MTKRALMMDTNAISRLMLGDETVLRIVNEARRILVCSVALGELESGFRGGTRYERNRSDLAEFCADDKVEKVFSTEDTVRKYGELMSALRQAGTKIPTNDVWIGAFAREHDAVVLSFDHHMQYMTPLGIELVKTAE